MKFLDQGSAVQGRGGEVAAWSTRPFQHHSEGESESCGLWPSAQLFAEGMDLEHCSSPSNVYLPPALLSQQVFVKQK